MKCNQCTQKATHYVQTGKPQPEELCINCLTKAQAKIPKVNFKVCGTIEEDA